MSKRTGRPCRIRMELVRQVGHPAGDGATGYELVLPLDRDGHIDATSWVDDPGACVVRRFRPGLPAAQGTLARAPRGRWYFDYGAGSSAAGHEGLAEDRLTAGNFIAIVEDDGNLRTYRITSVTPVERVSSPAGAA